MTRGMGSAAIVRVAFCGLLFRRLDRANIWSDDTFSQPCFDLWECSDCLFDDLFRRRIPYYGHLQQWKPKPAQAPRPTCAQATTPGQSSYACILPSVMVTVILDSLRRQDSKIQDKFWPTIFLKLNIEKLQFLS